MTGDFPNAASSTNVGLLAGMLLEVGGYTGNLPVGLLGDAVGVFCVLASLLGVPGTTEIELGFVRGSGRG